MRTIKATRSVVRRLSAAFRRSPTPTSSPKVLIARSIVETHDRHRELAAQASRVLDNARQAQAALDDALVELEKTTSSVERAVLLAVESRANDNDPDAERFEEMAVQYARQLVSLEARVQELEVVKRQSDDGASIAKRALLENAAAVRTRLAEQQRLLRRIDQAEIQDQLGEAFGRFPGSNSDEQH